MSSSIPWRQADGALASKREVLTRGQALKEASRRFIKAMLLDARLESEALLRYVLGTSRIRLLLEREEELKPEEETAFFALIERRLKGEPLCYLTGHREFYALDFYVNSSVLIPRPETEVLVEKALKLARDKSLATTSDIGTGSGVIAVSLALNLPRAKIYATDISPAALEVARINAGRHGALNRITFLEGDLLEPLPERCDLIIANLPYVKEDEITGELSFEPRSALDGGADGLSQIRRFLPGLKDKLKPRGYFLMEIGMGQANTLTGLVYSLYPDAEIEIIKDLAGIERVASARIGNTECPARSQKTHDKRHNQGNNPGEDHRQNE